MGLNFDWITDFLAQHRPSPSFDLHDILPPIFEHYFLLESNYGIIDGFPFEDYPNDADSIPHLNKRHAIERLHGLFLNYNSEPLYRPIAIQQIATLFSVPYDVSTLTTIKQTPGITLLPKRTKQVLAALVSELLHDNDGRLYVHDYARYSCIDGIDFEQKSIIRTAAQYMQLQETLGFDSWSYLSVANKDWCLVTVEDYPYLILGCQDNILPVLKKTAHLEYFRTTGEL